jgi:predicted secreted Zn-dependent protease
MAIKLRILILGACLLLAGCYIDLVVPVGGAVVTDSGLYGCLAHETCELQVDHPYFSERFVAVPDPGYRFSHWSALRGNFCAGSTEPSCNQINSSAFLGRADLLPWLAMDFRYALTPVFVQETGAVIPAASPWHIRSSHRQVNYEVSGNFPADVLAAIQKDTNPLGLSAVTGAKPIGKADVAVSWSYQATEGAAGVCELTDAGVAVRYTTTVPQLAGNSLRLPAWQAGWASLQADILQHEIGHQEIYRARLAEFLRRLNAMADQPCAGVETEIRRIYAQIIEEIQQADDQYHLAVGASTSFWAYF